ncbi:hypothetical protein IKX12_01670 [Candidatus Saccharibacteria bacterium]|jgi:hypothetical protein|nr:hypothetical protein [Candidatus Saccharibacteria bacterium]
MYKFDDQFLEEVGLANMPAEQKQSFLDYAQEQLEIRIGEKMSAGMTDAQIEEFEKIIDGDQQTVDGLLANLGDYKNDEIYQRLLQNGASEATIVNDFVTAKWLNQNCPQYQQIIADSLAGLKTEISANKDAILAGE